LTQNKYNKLGHLRTYLNSLLPTILLTFYRLINNRIDNLALKQKKAP